MQRLTAEDQLLLWPDEIWPQDIGALAILDGSSLLEPDGRLRIGAVRQAIEASLHLVPRFRQVLHVPPRRLGAPLWVDAPAFDLGDHIGVRPLPVPGDEAQLLLAVEGLRRRRLDRSRPLWEMWFITGLPDRRVGLFVRMHHVIADGMAGVATIAAFLDATPDAVPASRRPWVPDPAPTAHELLDDERRRHRRQLREAVSRLAHPMTTARHALAVWPAVRELLAERPLPATSLDRRVGPDRNLALIRSNLDLVRQIARTHNATVNDVLLTAIAGGLRALLAGRGQPVDGVVLRIYVPVSLHQGPRAEARGNRIGQMVVALPAGIPDPVVRLRLIANETARRKARIRPSLGRLPHRGVAGRVFLKLLNRQHVNVTSADIPGPEAPLYLAGARVLEVFPLVQLIGTVSLAVGAMSYAGQFNIMVVTDRDACPDIGTFADGARAELRALAGREHDRHDDAVSAQPAATPPGQRVFDLAIPIRRPPAAVYAFLADIQDAEPIPRRATVRMIKDPSGATAVGTRWHEAVRLAPGCWLHVESVVSDAEAPSRLGMDFSSRWFTGHLTYDIDPGADGCVLRQRETLRPRPPGRWLGPVIERRLRPRLLRRLEDIKAVLEGAPARALVPPPVRHRRRADSGV